MGADNDGSIPEFDLNLDDWDPEDTYLAEKPDLTWEDLHPKKQLPRDQLATEKNGQKPERWEHQLEEGSKPPVVRPVVADGQEEVALRPAPFEMLAGDVEDVIPDSFPRVKENAEGDEGSRVELVAKDAEYVSESSLLEEDDGTFADCMAVLEQILVLRKRQSIRQGRPDQEAELMALAHETLEKLPIDVHNHLDYIAEFVARVIDMDVS